MSETREPLFAEGATLDSHIEAFGTSAGASAEAPTAPKKERHTLTLPKSVATRFRAVIVTERRTQSVVLDKVLEDFTRAGTSEPRPYIEPSYLAEPTEKLTLMLTPDVFLALQSRADYEGRTVSMILIRAVLDYLAASPDDPVKGAVQ